MGAASCRGQVKVATADLAPETSGVAHQGDVEDVVNVPAGNPREKTFDLDRTQIDLRNFAFTSKDSAADEPDWRGRRDAEGALTIRHLGVHGGKLDIRFRGLVGPRGAFGKAMARYGIGLKGKDHDLTLTRVGMWYRQDDIRCMPPLLHRYAGESDKDEK